MRCAASSLPRPALILALAAALALQTYLLYAPVNGEGEIPWNLDKVAHACMFGGPTLLGLASRLRWTPIALALYAPASELIQSTAWVGRDPDPWDVVADVTGIILAVGLTRFVSRRWLP